MTSPGSREMSARRGINAHPLDGTNNDALGIPCDAVAVGILRGGTPYAGVVHDPNTGFSACPSKR